MPLDAVSYGLMRFVKDRDQAAADFFSLNAPDFCYIDERHSHEFAFTASSHQRAAMLRALFHRLNVVGRYRARRAERAQWDAWVLEYHRQSRAYFAEMHAKGQGHIAYAEQLALLGIDVNSKERPRIVALKGVRIRK